MTILSHDIPALDRIEADLERRVADAEVTYHRYLAIRRDPTDTHRMSPSELTALIHAATIELNWRKDELSAYRSLVRWAVATNGMTVQVVAS